MKKMTYPSEHLELQASTVLATDAFYARMPTYNIIHHLCQAST